MLARAWAVAGWLIASSLLASSALALVVTWETMIQHDARALVERMRQCHMSVSRLARDDWTGAVDLHLRFDRGALVDAVITSDDDLDPRRRACFEHVVRQVSWHPPEDQLPHTIVIPFHFH